MNRVYTACGRFRIWIGFSRAPYLVSPIMNLARRHILLVFLVAGLFQAGEAAAQPLAQVPTEVEIKFAGYQGLELQGTLSLPAQVPEGGAAGVLLLPGSGPTDREGNQPPRLMTNLLQQMAQRLAKEGFVVLRFDKRSAHVYANKWPNEPSLLDAFLSWEAFTGDAKAALEFLRSRKEVDPARTAIVGHSEGGLIALQLGSDLTATGSPPAALVLAGTAATRLDEVMRLQVAAALERQKADEAIRKQYAEALDKAAKSIRETRTVPGDLPAGLRPLFPPFLTRLLYSYMTLEPTALAGQYKGPVLVLHGSMDNQVPADHTEKMFTALTARAGGVQERVVVPNASHNLKPASSLTDAGLAGDVVPQALDAMAGFLSRVCGRNTAASRPGS